VSFAARKRIEKESTCFLSLHVMFLIVEVSWLMCF